MKRKIIRILMILVVFLCAIMSTLSYVFIPRLIGSIIDNYDSNSVYFYLKKMLILIIIYLVARILMGLFNARIATDIVAELRRNVGKFMLRNRFSDIVKYSSSYYQSLIGTDGDILADGIIATFNQFFISIITIIMTAYFMLSYAEDLAIIVIILSILTCALGYIMARLSFKSYSSQAKMRDRTFKESLSFLKNHKILRLYKAESHNRLYETNEEYAKASKNAMFLSSITNPLIRLLNNTIYAIVAISGSLLIVDGKMSLGMLMGFLMYINQFTQPLNELSLIVSEMQNALVSYKRLKNIPSMNTVDKKESVKRKMDGEILFDNINFSYKNNIQILKNFNLNIRDRERIAIVGRTGVGKSTLINLLMGFYIPDSGNIYIDDIDVNAYDRNSFFENIGFLPQETWIIDGSIMDNLSYGNNKSHKEIIEIVKSIGAESFILKLPNGYNTMVNDDSRLLSEGERQLICISRILLRNPSIIILDEATSNLDSYTQMLIQKSIAKLMKNKTCIVIAHRRETIEEMDRIVEIGGSV